MTGWKTGGKGTKPNMGWASAGVFSSSLVAAAEGATGEGGGSRPGNGGDVPAFREPLKPFRPLKKLKHKRKGQIRKLDLDLDFYSLTQSTL
jgi:hypothetical protein